MSWLVEGGVMQNSQTDNNVKVTIDTFKEADLEDFLELSREEFSKAVLADPDHADWKDLHVESIMTNPDYIRWKHLDSPFGASTFIRLVASGKTVGRSLFQPRSFYSTTQKFHVACGGDLLIQRKFRSPPSNFINLILASDGISSFDFVYHTANEISHTLYRSRLLRFPNPFSLSSYGFPLRIAGLLSSIMGRRIDALDWLIAPFRWLVGALALVFCSIVRLDISQRPMSDEGLENLFQNCLRQSGPLLARTNDYLKWRFGDASNCPAKIFRIDRQGQLIGYVVTRQVEMGGLKHLVLMDFLLESDTPLSVQFALRLWLIRSAITAKADTLFTMVNSFNEMARKCVGFPLVRIPDKLLPHATPIFIRSYRHRNSEFETDRSLHFALADLDYF